MDANKTAGEEARRQLHKILNKSWRQHPTRHQLYGHLPTITKIIQVRRIRHAGHCCRSRDELISDVLLWPPTYGRAKAGQPAHGGLARVGRLVRTYLYKICADTACSLEDLLGKMDYRDGWRERERGGERERGSCGRHELMLMYTA